MSIDLLFITSLVAAGFLILIGIVALVASVHPDEKRRRDAAKILDKLLRARDRDRP